MLADSFRGNREIITRLEKSLASGNVPHAYLFAGSDYDSRMRLAKDMAKAVLCPDGGCGTCAVCRKIEDGNHVDIKYVEGRSGKALLTEDIEEMQKFLMRKPYESDRNIAVITKADYINDRAEKKLLKTLEEPEEGTIIILLADNLSGIDETIRSRCVIYRLREAEKNYSTEVTELADEVFQAIVSGDTFVNRREIAGRVDQAQKKADGTNPAYEVLECLEEKFMKRITDDETECLSSVHQIEETKKMLASNVKVTSAFMYMFLKAEEDRW